MSEPRAAYRVNYPDPAAVDGALAQEARRLAATDARSYAGPEPGLIRALMERQRWTQTGVSEALRVNVSTVRRWCTDREQQQHVEIPFSAWSWLLLRAGLVSVEALDGPAVPAY